MPTKFSLKLSCWSGTALRVVIIGALTVPMGVALQYPLQAQPDTTPRNWDDPKAAQKLDNARLKKAKQIRAEYRSWALRHKARTFPNFKRSTKCFHL